jgi:hypothetical protein
MGKKTVRERILMDGQIGFAGDKRKAGSGG